MTQRVQRLFDKLFRGNGIIDYQVLQWLLICLYYKVSALSSLDYVGLIEAACTDGFLPMHRIVPERHAAKWQQLTLRKACQLQISLTKSRR